MTNTKLIFALLLVCFSGSLAFPQTSDRRGTSVFTPTVNQQWVYPPYNIDMNGLVPSATAIPGATVGTRNVSNGAYDQGGLLLFYVKDLKVYKGSNSQLMGTLPMPIGSGGTAWNTQGSELEIVLVPGFTNKFYVIYTLRYGTQGCLCYAEINCSSGSPVSVGPAFNSILTSTYYSLNLLEYNYYDAQGLAVSKLLSANSKRYLFTVGFKGDPRFGNNRFNYGGLLRWTIDAAGVSNETVIATPADLGNYYGSLTWLTVFQMSLSGDQTRLAWGSGTQYTGQQQSVFEVKLSPTYSFVPGSFKQYYLPNPTHASFVAGVEYAGRSIYASTWDGIYFIPNYGSTASLIPGSTNLTHQPLSQMEGSQLQYVESTSKIVGVRVTNTPANTGSLFSLDPSNNTTATIMSNPLKSGALSFGYGQAFTLPELIK